MFAAHSVRGRVVLGGGLGIQNDHGGFLVGLVLTTVSWHLGDHDIGSLFSYDARIGKEICLVTSKHHHCILAHRICRVAFRPYVATWPPSLRIFHVFFIRVVEVVIVKEVDVKSQFRQSLFLSSGVHLTAHETAVRFVVKACVDAVFHEYDDINRVKYFNVLPEHQTRVSFRKSDQRLEHTNGFPVFCESCAASQE